MSKSQVNTTPSYTSYGAANQAVVSVVYKNSTSTATSYSRTSGMTINMYTTSDASSTNTQIIRFKSKTQFQVYIASSSYGLLKQTDYTYIIIYSE